MDHRKCQTSEPAADQKPPAVMDFRPVLIFLCLHIAQASCKPLNSGAVNETIQMIRGEIRKTLEIIAKSELLLNTSCGSLNATELLGPERQQFPSIKCYLEAISELPHDLPTLQTAVQYVQDVAELTNSPTASENCSLPSFDNEFKGLLYAKCLLDILHDRLGKAVLNH